MQLSQNLWDWLSILANIIQIGTFIVVILLFMQARRQLRRYIKAREEEVTNQPWAIVIGIGDDISGQVKPYLASQNLATMPVEVCTRPGHLPADHFYEVLRELLRIKARLTQSGVTEVHLFYRGPVSLAMGIGAILDNWVPVKVYRYESGNYKFDFVMDKGSLLGLISTGPGSTIEDVFRV